MRSVVALLVGLAAGVAASVHYDGRGEGFGEMEYDYFTFSWRGRKVELHVEKVAWNAVLVWHGCGLNRGENMKMPAQNVTKRLRTCIGWGSQPCGNPHSSKPVTAVKGCRMVPWCGLRVVSLVAAIAASLVLYLAIAGIGRAQNDPEQGWVPVKPRAASPWPASNPWIRLWTRRDHNLRASEHVAAAVFHVSERWLRSCRSSEGGSTARETLRRALRAGGYGHGWNTSGGSFAFGPWQFMLDSKPAPSSHEWGTFGRYVHGAFAAARARRVVVPFRFKTPDSYVGQALTAAFMFSIGQSGQWTGAGC